MYTNSDNGMDDGGGNEKGVQQNSIQTQSAIAKRRHQTYGDLSVDIISNLCNFFDRHKQDEWWRYFTYSLVHTDESHLYLNLALFVSIGTMLHTTNNTITLLLLYMIGVSQKSQQCM